MTIREKTQEFERLTLSEFASFSDSSKGREHFLEECPVRTPYQRDRDRIIHCNSFRRLMHKTQVFLSPEGDHYRTRLTHTLEVSQIARTICRALRLNEDLAEAIALGHDLGHTPFGHAGEAALNQVMDSGFAHSRQSVRVVQHLERDGKGLNLTFEVCDGILNHSSAGTAQAATLEGKVVRYSDKIAYMNHDIDDAVRAGILSEEELPWSVKATLGRSKSRRITTLINSIINNSSSDIVMDTEVKNAYDELLEFMFSTVYVDPKAKGEEGKAQEMILKLYHYFLKNPHKMPCEYKVIIENEGEQRAVCDYISGMSDRYCVSVFNDIFIPKSWGF